MMIALNIYVFLKRPSGGAVDFGAESFGLEADDASLGVGAVCEHAMVAPNAVYAQNANRVHFFAALGSARR